MKKKRRVSLLDLPGRKPKTLSRDTPTGQFSKSFIDEIERHYDIIGLAAANQIDPDDVRRFHPSKNDLVELQTFAKSSTKPTLASLDGDEEPFMEEVEYLNGV